MPKKVNKYPELMKVNLYCTDSPELAHILDNTTPLAEYKRCFDTVEYKKFSEDMDKQFEGNLEKILRAQVFEAIMKLKNADTKTSEYGRIANHLLNMIRLTDDILKKLNNKTFNIPEEMKNATLVIDHEA